jgi:hypothetical protein
LGCPQSRSFLGRVGGEKELLNSPGYVQSAFSK